MTTETTKKFSIPRIPRIPAMIFLAILIVAGIAATPAHANVIGDSLGKVWDWVKGEAVTSIILVALGLLSAVLGTLYIKVASTLKEGGEALTQLGTAMLSKNKGDAEKIIPEIKDVYDIWKKTPDRYINVTPNAPNNPANPGQ